MSTDLTALLFETWLRYSGIYILRSLKLYFVSLKFKIGQLFEVTRNK